MENASKALIIAGSILLALALIGIGVYIYSVAAGTIDETRLTAQEVEAYNSQFEQYSGIQRGSTVRAMLDRVKTHNALYRPDYPTRVIVVVTHRLDGGIIERGDAADDGDATSQHITNVKNSISVGKNYEITFRYTSNGLVKAIGIVEQ